MLTRSDSAIALNRTFALLSAITVVAALYFAKDVLLPLALAILFSFLLAPLTKRLEKWHFRRIPAVLLVVAIAFGAIGSLSYVLALQVYDLAYQLPTFKENIVAKVDSLQGSDDGIVKSVSSAIEDMRKKIAHKDPPARLHDATEESKSDGLTPGEAAGKASGENPLTADTGESAEPSEEEVAVKPVPVEVVTPLSATQIAQSVLGPIVAPLGTAAMVIVFVIFMLIERENLRNRVIHLIAPRQLNVATQAFDDAASRVSRYLLMQLIVNVGYGLVVALGLYLIGLPNAFLWGAMATLLRFIPYIGPWIAASLPILLAAAVFEGWTRPLLVVGLFVANELISNNVIEPWLYSSTTGVSTMGILVSAVFWTWLWGPVGLIMSTPLTVCLTVIGRYVPQFSFLHTLLSDEEVLSPDARFYQRLLALDSEEASDIADEYLASNSLESLYDKVLLPALSMAEHDRHHGNLDETRQRFIFTTMRELVDDLGLKAIASLSLAGPQIEDGVEVPAPALKAAVPVLCLPARDEADEIAGAMLCQLLEAKGLQVVLMSAQTLSGEMLIHVAEEAPSVIVVSALPPLAATHARYLCKRLRPKFPEIKIVVGLWETLGTAKKAQAKLVETGINQVVTTLGAATQHLSQLVASQQLLDSNTVATEHSAA